MGLGTVPSATADTRSATLQSLVSLRYSGSKRQLLRGQFGADLLAGCGSAGRFVDLFAGSGVVSHFVACATTLPVVAVDLQRYAVTLAAAIASRTTPVNAVEVLGAWFARAHALPGMELTTPWRPLDRSRTTAVASQESRPLTPEGVVDARRLSQSSVGGFMLRHYGGHYFSPVQADAMDRLLISLPDESDERTFALACLLVSAARASASPGHLAQPFQPKPNQLRWIENAWRKNIFDEITRVGSSWGPAHAGALGASHRTDAQLAARELVRDGDLVFCDPPYSDVQYSRLYHVLEGLARGGWEDVFGAGRAPRATDRRRSQFSSPSAADDFADLLDALWYAKPESVIVTVPAVDCGNRLTGDLVAAMARDRWHVEGSILAGHLSTLGGTPDGRGTRRATDQHVLRLRPRTYNA